MSHSLMVWLKRRCSKILLVVVIFTGVSISSPAQDIVAGQVRNQTRSQAAAGDQVILFRFEPGQQGFREQARTQADTNGSFTFTLAATASHSDQMHGSASYLVRVIHQGVNYDSPASPDSTSKRATVNAVVFDAASRVDNIAGTIEIIRAGTAGTQLHVSDMIEVRNQSNPPLTQFGERSFDVYLPAHAKISSVLAAGPGNAAVLITAMPIAGDSGHYSVNFPLRPGATKFAFNYDVPYSGKANFQIRHSYPLQQFAVMIPPTMKFSSSTAFKPLPTGNEKYHVQAIGQLNAGRGPEFEISGTGSLPSIRTTDATEAHAAAHIAPSAVVPQSAPEATASMAPASGQTASQSYASDQTAATQSRPPVPLPWILGILGLLLATTSAVAIRGTRSGKLAAAHTNIVATNATRTHTSLIDGLKEELFQLEAARIRGTISIEEYALTRSALEETVKRALLRAS